MTVDPAARVGYSAGARLRGHVEPHDISRRCRSSQSGDRGVRFGSAAAPGQLPPLAGGFAFGGGFVSFFQVDREVRRALFRGRYRVAWDVYETICQEMDTSGPTAGSYTGPIRRLAREAASNPGTVARTIETLVNRRYLRVEQPDTAEPSSKGTQGNARATPRATPGQRLGQRLTPLMADGSTVFGSAIATPGQHLGQRQGNTLEEEEQRRSKRTPPTPPRGESADSATATPPPKKSRSRSGKKNAEKRPPNPEHRAFIEWWCEHYSDFHNEQAYVFQGGKDGSAVKHLVASYSDTQLQRAALAAWRSRDAFQLKQATTISGFAGIVQQVLATPEQVRLPDSEHDRAHQNGRPREHRESQPERLSSMFSNEMIAQWEEDRRE